MVLFRTFHECHGVGLYVCNRCPRASQNGRSSSSGSERSSTVGAGMPLPVPVVPAAEAPAAGWRAASLTRSILHALRSLYHLPAYSLAEILKETFTSSPSPYPASSFTLSAPHTLKHTKLGYWPSWYSMTNSCFCHSPLADTPFCTASFRVIFPVISIIRVF